MRILSMASKVAARRRPLPLRRRVPDRRPRRTPLSREIARLRAHFRDVLGELRTRDVAQLSLPQRGARARLIDELERYARAGRFPRNLDFPGARVPYFVDARDTRCAVAHLLDFTGEAALVAKIRATQNNAFVPAFAGDPALVAWLEQVGLTAAEAARIQPGYCFMNKADTCFCNRAGSPSTVAEATVTMTLDTSHVHVKIDAVHGDPSLATVGQEVDVIGAAAVGQKVIFGIGAPATAGGMPSYGSLIQLKTDGTVELMCGITVPALKKADAIAAFFAPDTNMSDSTSGCGEHLATVDSTWGESQCENTDGGGGCSMTASGGASSLLLGTLVVGIAAWSRRRGRRFVRSRRAPLQAPRRLS